MIHSFNTRNGQILNMEMRIFYYLESKDLKVIIKKISDTYKAVTILS